MSAEDRDRWDAKYRLRQGVGSPTPWLVEVLPRLKPAGAALDLAAGDGANAIASAESGWQVTAIDISEIGIRLGQAKAGNLPIQWICADLDTYEPSRTYDLVMAFRFFDRKRLGSLIQKSVCTDGWFVAETYNERHLLQPNPHVRNREYLLRNGEWLELLEGFEILEHDESGPTSRVLARCSS